MKKGKNNPQLSNESVRTLKLKEYSERSSEEDEAVPEFSIVSLPMVTVSDFIAMFETGKVVKMSILHEKTHEKQPICVRGPA